MEALFYGLGIGGSIAVIIILVLVFSPLKELLLYWRSVRSRRTYICPMCHTTYTLEYMRGTNCSACGARLVEQVNSGGRLNISTEELPVSIEDRETETIHRQLSSGEENNGTEPK